MSRGAYDVAVMHDFFVDRIVRPGNLGRLFRVAGEKARAGGGSVHGVVQEDIRGGNAVNLAHALARLGNRVLLITHSDAEHAGLLSKAFDGLGAELRIKPPPPGLTVALEEGVNVMLSDAGGAGSFPPSLLDGDDWKALRQSSVICSVNWAANVEGTELLVALRRRLGNGKMIFLNPSDVRDRFGQYVRLVNLLKRRRIVDWVSLNEFEAASTVLALGLNSKGPRSWCAAIAGALGIRVDVHTERAVFTCTDGKLVGMSTRHLRPKRLTGAGDVWDAASITGFLKGMEDGARLEFANAAARLFVGSEAPVPPTLRQVERELR